MWMLVEGGGVACSGIQLRAIVFDDVFASSAAWSVSEISQCIIDIGRQIVSLQDRVLLCAGQYRYIRSVCTASQHYGPSCSNIFPYVDWTLNRKWPHRIY